MNAYLFTWNPTLWPWDDLSKKYPKGVPYGTKIKERWSSGKRKNFEIGAHAFLMRVGSKPQGLVASGKIVSETVEDYHWDNEKAQKGEKCLYVNCEWDCLLSEDFCLPLSDLRSLNKETFFNWTPQAGGVQIPEGLADRLELSWASHTSILKVVSSDVDDELSGLEAQTRWALILHRRREALLRKEKIAQEMKKGNGRLKCAVENCNFDFFEVYGQLGYEFVHVHHLKPLANRAAPSETKLSDLEIVCANCHAMIHRNGGCRPLEGLIPLKKS